MATVVATRAFENWAYRRNIWCSQKIFGDYLWRFMIEDITEIFYKHMFTEKFRISQFKKNILHYILQRKNEYLCRENMSEFLYVILCRRSNTWVCLLYQKRQNFLQKELFMKISVWNSSWLILLLFGVLHYFCTYIRIILRIFTENNWVRYSFFLCRI